MLATQFGQIYLYLLQELSLNRSLGLLQQNTLGVQTFRTFLVATCNLLKTAVIISLEFLRHVLIRVNNVDQDHTAQIKVF